MRVALYACLCAVVLAGALLACSGAQPTASDSETNTASASASASVEAVPAAPSLALPSLIGLSIDEVRSRLGKPQEQPAEPSAREKEKDAADTWKNTFEVQGATLVATFNAHTRVVRDIVLLGTNEEELLHRAGLDPNATEYIVLPVTDSVDVTRTTGIRMVPRE